MLWRWSHKKSEEENTKESEERADTEARGRIGGLRDLPLNSATRSIYFGERSGCSEPPVFSRSCSMMRHGNNCAEATALTSNKASRKRNVGICSPIEYP